MEKTSGRPRPQKMSRISSPSILEARKQGGTLSSSYPTGDEADDEAEGKGDNQDDGSRYGHAPEEKPHRHRLGVLNEEGSEEHADNKKGYSLRSHTLYPPYVKIDRATPAGISWPIPAPEITTRGF